MKLNDQMNLMSTGEASRLLGVSLETVRKWIYDGTLPATKTKLGYLLEPEEVETVHIRHRNARADTAFDSWLKWR